MNGYQQAVQFNNHGVALLASGSNDQREAIAKFRCALAVIKAGIIDDSKNEDDDHQIDCQCSCQSLAVVEMDHTVVVPIGETQHENGVHCPLHSRTTLITEEDFLEPIVVPFPQTCYDEDEETFFVYHRGFIISRSSSSSATSNTLTSIARRGKRPYSATVRQQADNLKNTSYSHQTIKRSGGQTIVKTCLSLDVLSSVVVFNMALAHNVEEATQFKNSMNRVGGASNISALKDVSRRLYDMSLGLLGNTLRDPDVSKSTIEAMVVLTATSNNMSKLLFDQGKFESARSMLKTLWYTTSWICEKVLLPRQQRKGVSPSTDEEGTLSQYVAETGSFSPSATELEPEMVESTRNTATTNNRILLGAIGSNYPRSGAATTTPTDFFFTENEIEGFIMNVMLMYHSQPPIAAKAA